MTRLKARSLTVEVGGRRLLDKVDVEVSAGQFVAVIGANGAGKSTLLRCLAGVQDHGGVVSCDLVPDFSDRRTRAAHIALVPQGMAPPPEMTVDAFVALGRRAHLGLWQSVSDRDRALVTEALEAFDIADMSDRFVQSLSGGEWQRALMAQAFAQQTDVLLLDEPTTGLDIGHRRQLWRALDGLRTSGKTVVMAAHDIEAAAARCDRLLVLHSGRVLASGSPDSVMSDAVLSQAFDCAVAVRRLEGRWLLTDT